MTRRSECQAATLCSCCHWVIAGQKGSLSPTRNAPRKPLISKGLDRAKGYEQNETMKIGYARFSTEEQNLSLQKQALRAAGCKVIIEDQGISGGRVARPGLADALSRLKKGDVLVVWRLDRLGRSLAHLIEIIAGLGAAGAGFASLTESIDTTTAGGRLSFT